MWPKRSEVHSKPRKAVKVGVEAARACSRVASHLRNESSGLTGSASAHCGATSGSMQYSLATIGRSALSECSEPPMKSRPNALPDCEVGRAGGSPASRPSSRSARAATRPAGVGRGGRCAAGATSSAMPNAILPSIRRILGEGMPAPRGLINGYSVKELVKSAARRPARIDRAAQASCPGRRTAPRAAPGVARQDLAGERAAVHRVDPLGLESLEAVDDVAHRVLVGEDPDLAVEAAASRR